jgi:hypothetical protein
MQIKKDLKYATFEYDEGTKSFKIINDDGGTVVLNKVYAFAFMRFVVRMAQRNWLRGKPSTKDLNESGNPETLAIPDQMTFLEREN